MEKELSIDEIKQISLNIMDEIHEFCVANNLRYILFSGTLLGCIRHKGFIPWDDDIDIAMPREDYLIFSKKFKSNNCVFLDCYNYKNYYLPWGKVADLNTLKIEPVFVKKEKYGVDIDVYPCDYIESLEQGYFLKKKLGRIDRKRSHSIRLYNGNPIKDFFTLFYRNKHINYCIKENVISSKFNNLKHNFIFRNCAFSNADDIYPLNIFDERILMQFEDRHYYAPKQYDEVLTKRYGKYMKMPPLSEQKPHHFAKTYFVEANK